MWSLVLCILVWFHNYVYQSEGERRDCIPVMNDIKIDYICSCQGRLTETLASTPAPQRGTRSFLSSFSPTKTTSLNATRLSLQSHQYHPLHPYTLSLYTQNLHFCSFLLNFGNVEVNFGEVKITVVLGAWRKMFLRFKQWEGQLLEASVSTTPVTG